MEAKLKKWIQARAKNRRIEILMYQKQGEEPVFLVYTKRLVSFSERKITETKTMYGVQTFVVMKELFELMLGDSEVNKLINPYMGWTKEKYKATTNLQQ